MKGYRREGRKRGYLLAGALAAFCVLTNGITAFCAPASGGEERELLTAGVGQILDSVSEDGGEKEDALDEEDLQSGTAGEAKRDGVAENASAAEKAAEERSVNEATPDQISSDQTAAGEKSVKAAEGEETAGRQEESSFQDELVMAAVEDVLNVRSEPDEESGKVGYLYADCGGTILERRDGWTKLESGGLVGWAKDDYLLFGEDALTELEDVGHLVARVTGETLRIRKEPSTDAEVYDLAAQGETYEVVNKVQLHYSEGIELSGEWAAVDYEGRTGYVSSEYIEVSFEYDHGETLEEIAARQQTQEKTDSGKSGEKQEAKTQASPGRQNAGSIPAGTSDVTLLAALIQCEAGSESYEGKLAVGAVVVNRVKSASYPNTVSDVIFASGQFTPAGSGKLARVISGGNISASCIQAAGEALAGVTNVGSATHFRRAGGRDGIVIGNHVFW